MSSGTTDDVRGTTDDVRAGRGLGTVPREPSSPVGIGAAGWLRWAWRQLTSMRTALLLLFALAVASVPGSVLPQRAIDPSAVNRYYRAHPDLAPWLDRLWGFDVFTAPWYASIYLLLVLSITGCVLPRARQHLDAIRSRPPAAPRHLGRLPVARRWTSDAAPDVVLADAEALLRRARYRVDRRGDALSAETGYLREVGNLVFHTALIALLVSVAYGRLVGFSADVAVPEGRGFSNTVALYDAFRPGATFDESDLTPLTVRLEDLDVRYQLGGQQSGAPRAFTARVQWRENPGETWRRAEISPNHPLNVRGTKVFLLGNGYAPRITVRDRAGEVVFSGAVPFLPQADASGMQSNGVVKVGELEPQQLGLKATFLPTAVDTPLLGPQSIFPDATNPRLYLTGVYLGQLGIDDGTPQNVYRLETRDLILQEKDGKALTATLSPGEQFRLPDGSATVTFDGVARFAAFKVADDPGRWPALLAATLAIAGLLGSLFVRRRRVFVRAGAAAGEPGRTVVEVGALARTEDESLGDTVDALLAPLRTTAEEDA